MSWAKCKPQLSHFKKVAAHMPSVLGDCRQRPASWWRRTRNSGAQLPSCSQKRSPTHLTPRSSKVQHKARTLRLLSSFDVIYSRRRLTCQRSGARQRGKWRAFRPPFRLQSPLPQKNDACVKCWSRRWTMLSRQGQPLTQKRQPPKLTPRQH